MEIQGVIYRDNGKENGNYYSGLYRGYNRVYYRVLWADVKIMAPFWGALNIRCRIIIGTEKKKT